MLETSFRMIGTVKPDIMVSKGAINKRTTIVVWFKISARLLRVASLCQYVNFFFSRPLYSIKQVKLTKTRY